MHPIRVKIQLDTLSQIKQFVEICAKLPAGAKVQVVDETTNQRVSATSLLGVISTVDWKETWLEAQEDVYDAIKDFVPVSGLTQ